MSRKNVAAAEVRTWGRANITDLPEVATKCLGETARGRLHPDLIAAFNKANPRKVYVTASEAEKPTVSFKYPAKDAKGRNISKSHTMTTEAARALLGQRVAGEDGKVRSTRGKFNMAALVEAYVASLV